ncbi:M15 family metallopeptidase [Hathewaya histolytica]|uniref:D-alanyl-D-alanine carboxypeptidase n=2 Tax=Hathewaya histolytica TaxID=1498 RepID=A0A4U9RVE7_HATHI|nr:M15 family metallopeptidase [Hathewaya histolytica]VTQ95626.1 D-alanyl-D-alanine carboxypeptidase [Hathewaya histolytica]
MSNKYNKINKKNKKYILLFLFILSSCLIISKNLDNIYIFKKQETSEEVKSSNSASVDTNSDFEKNTKNTMETYLREKYKIDDTTYTENRVTYVKNLGDIGIFVSKKRSLTCWYEPEGLLPVKIPFCRINFSKENMMVKDAAKAVEKLVGDAEEEGIYFKGVSAYRSYNTQETTYLYISKTKGEEHADVYSARPGQSEHQTGLSIDLGIRSLNYDLNENFADTKEGIWLSKNCSKYGFIIRYPKGKEHITGYSFEPWHIRYVGAELAKYLTENNLTLDEFYDFK